MEGGDVDVADDGKAGFGADAGDGEEKLEEIAFFFSGEGIERFIIFFDDVGKVEFDGAFEGKFCVGAEGDFQAIADAVGFDDGIEGIFFYELAFDVFVHVKFLRLCAWQIARASASAASSGSGRWGRRSREAIMRCTCCLLDEPLPTASFAFFGVYS